MTDNIVKVPYGYLELIDHQYNAYVVSYNNVEHYLGKFNSEREARYEVECSYRRYYFDALDLSQV